MNRKYTRKIKIGTQILGGQNKVLIQSMCNIKTSKVKEVIEQINSCAKEGADLMRVSVLDFEDAKAISKIKRKIKIPLIGDIHFDYRLALAAIENGIDAIRINPSNIGDESRIKKIIDVCKKKNIAIRIGLNSGSVEKKFLNKYKDKTKALVCSCKNAISIFKKYKFENIVLSIKSSNVLETIKAYESLSEEFDYPLHLGITESSITEIGSIRSSIALSPLLLNGIGDTIRISLSDNPIEEIKVAKRILHDVGLYPNYPTLISCPTCGRTEVELIGLTKKIFNYLEKNSINLKVAIMGCIVNGPGEARDADIGLAGGKNEFVLFKKGKIIRKILAKNAYQEMIKEINSITQ